MVSSHEWHQPLQEARDIAVSAKSAAEQVQEQVRVQGRHLALLDEKVDKMAVDLATVKETVRSIPDKTMLKLLWVIVPLGAATIVGLGIIIAQGLARSVP